MRRRLLWLMLLLSVPLFGSIFGCGEGEDLAAMGADRQVALYLYPSTDSGLPAQVVAYANMESNTDGTIRLDTGVSVQGRLILPVENELDGMVTDTPISGVITASLADSWLEFQTTAGTSASASVDSPTFDLNVPTGHYDILVEPSSDSYDIPRQLLTDRYISILLNGKTLDLELDPGQPLEVKLTYSDGTPISNASVYTLNTETGAYSSSKSKSIGVGSYQIQVTRGEHELWMAPDAYNSTPMVHKRIATITIEDTAPEPVNYTNYSITNYTISGKAVNNAATPVEDVAVYATRRANDNDGEYTSQTTTDAAGTFSLTLPEGDYDLIFRPPSSAPSLSGLLKSEVYVGNDRELGDIVLASRVGVKLTVVDSYGEAIAGASVTMVPEDRANFSTSGLSDSDGHCELNAGLGSYLIEIDPPVDTEFVRQVLPITVTSETSLGEIELPQGFTTTLQFLANDKPVSDLVIQAWELSADEDSPVYQIGSAISDEQGQAQLILPLL